MTGYSKYPETDRAIREKDFALGEKVRFSQELIRPNVADWRALRYTEHEIARREGFLMGFRTVTDMAYDSEDGYYADGSHRVALVVDHLYRNPRKVPFDNLVSENPR